MSDSIQRIIFFHIFAKNIIIMRNNLNNNNVENDLANAISMDELLAKVKEHIHELYQKPNYANT